MADGDTFSITAIYEATGNGVTAANTINIDVVATEVMVLLSVVPLSARLLLLVN